MSNQEFHGRIGRTYEESEPWWPETTRAPEDAPNILMVVFDDVGFGQLSCYGGLVDTPNIDRLADNGLRYTNFTTTALCSPTRSCLLTGRNHHSNALACITEGSTGFPGSNGSIPFENGFLSEMLLEQGYNTFADGKWHLTPAEQQTGAGPFDRWPLGRGFERYYGFLGGETHQYYPDLVSGNEQVEPPATPEEGYHFTEDMTDRAIQQIRDAHVVAPDKPFFMYYAPGAAHAPHHVRSEWSDKYAGKFDMGWDAAREEILARQKELGIVPEDTDLPPRDPDVPVWDDLSDDERQLYARMMEVFAGFLEHADYHLGRLLDSIEAIDELENTLVVVVSDNGASSEGGPTGSVNENKFFNNIEDDLEENLQMLDELGGPDTYNHYPWGWTWAGNTPFRRWKRETYRGGTSDPMVVSWPKGIDARGEIRSQFTHAVDVVPTILEALEMDAPAEIRGIAQSPIEGISFAYSFDEPDAPEQHVTQYYEMFAHRSIYHDGWRAVHPWPFGKRITSDDLSATSLEDSGWELYHIREDFSEAHDVAAEHPEKVLELAQLWWTEAGKYNVLPLDGRGAERLGDPRPQLSGPRDEFVYYPGGQAIPGNSAPRLINRPHTITAHATIPEGGAEGVLLSQGSKFAGYTFYVQDNHLHYIHNYAGVEEYHVASDGPIPEGAVELKMEFEPTGEPDIVAGKGVPATVRLFVDDEQVAEESLPVTTPITFALSGEGLACGWNAATSVTDRYEAPFRFTGELARVVVETGGEALHDESEEMEADMDRILSNQ